MWAPQRRSLPPFQGSEELMPLPSTPGNNRLILNRTRGIALRTFGQVDTTINSLQILIQMLPVIGQRPPQPFVQRHRRGPPKLLVNRPVVAVIVPHIDPLPVGGIASNGILPTAVDSHQ